MLFFPLLTIVNTIATVFTVSSETKKIRNKRAAFDIVNTSDIHDWSKNVNTGTGINPSVSLSDFDKLLQHLEDQSQLEMNKKILELNDLKDAVEVSFSDIQKKWNLYDERFEDILRWGLDIEKHWKNSSIKWRVDSKDGYEIMNGNTKDPIKFGIENSSQYNGEFDISTRSYLKIGNKAFLIKFQGFEWQNEDHYVPYTWTGWSQQIGSTGFWKDYMGPRFQFAKAITVAGRNGSLINVLDDNYPILGVGLYYDSDREDMREKWKKLIKAKEELSSAACSARTNAVKLKEALKKTAFTYKDYSKKNQLDIPLRQLQFWVDHLIPFNQLPTLTGSFTC